jgi:transposase
MIFSTRRTQFLMCKEPTDMRLGYDGLRKLAKKVFGQNPYRGQYFAFVNRRRTSCKVYTWDGSGEVLICKRLSRGVFCRPNPRYKKQIRLSGSEFSQFFEGLNISGRILESVPHSRPRRKQLRFIPPYRKLTSTHATGGSISTGTGQPPSTAQ